MLSSLSVTMRTVLLSSVPPVTFGLYLLSSSLSFALFGRGKLLGSLLCRSSLGFLGGSSLFGSRLFRSRLFGSRLFGGSLFSSSLFGRGSFSTGGFCGCSAA